MHLALLSNINNRLNNRSYRSEKYDVGKIWKGQRCQEWLRIPLASLYHLDSTYCICML